MPRAGADDAPCAAAFGRSPCTHGAGASRCLLCAGRHQLDDGPCDEAELEELCRPPHSLATRVPADTTPPASWGVPPMLGHATLPEFMMRPNLTNFNEGSWGVCPKKVFDYHVNWMRAIEADPDGMYRPSLHAGSDAWDDALLLARTAFAKLVNADVDDLVFVPNASHG